MIEPIPRKWITSADNSSNDDEVELERYRSFINTLNGCEDYLLNRDGFILSSNLEAISITGYEEWEVIGSHLSKFYSLEDQLKGIPQSDLEKASKKSIFVTTGLRVKKRNSSFWAKIIIRALSNQGEVTGFKMTIQDITHRAVNNHRLKKLKDEYLSLFNNSFVGIYKFSLTDFHFLMMNEKATQILGLSEKGKRFDELFDERDVHNLLKELLSKKKVEDFEVKIKERDIWLRLSCRLFNSGNFVEGVMIDVTEYKWRDRELERVKNELDQFVYHASHEMRSPLATMLGIVNLIKYEKDISSVLNYSNILKERIQGVDQLLKSIVAISLNNNSKIGVDRIEWGEIISSLIREAKPPASIEVTCDLDESEPFFSDLTRVTIILKNLISNSIKYFNPSNPNPKVTITVISGKTHAEIRVADNGIGITPECLKEVFRMFYKATTHSHGCGLGLYTVKAMVDKLVGKIHVESKLGLGSTFFVFLPNCIEIPLIAKVK
jgi:PAS domain S-box-containing protein